MEKRLSCEHGIICRLPGVKLGYFGWPSVARLDDGSLVVSSSGLRSQHICPWGKTVLNFSRDQGRTWSAPRVINDSPLDDRDSGVVHLGGGRLLVTWFTSDNRAFGRDEVFRKWLGDEELDSWQTTLSGVTDKLVKQWIGSWIMLSDDHGATWSKALRAPVSSPHGPIILANSDLLYLGKDLSGTADGKILASRSQDGGHTWKVQGAVPHYPGTTSTNYHEPHVVELPDGRVVGMIRIENAPGSRLEEHGLVDFSLMQTESEDGGCTWSLPRALGFHGSPPHLLRHTSGTLVCVYGYRQPGYGQRVMLSQDNGATWDWDWIIRDDAPDWDLGYPASVELEDGSLLTVYYQKVTGDAKYSLLWSRWRLPCGSGSLSC
jgi:sialidase-1